MRTRIYGELRPEGPVDDARESARKPTPDGTPAPGSSPAGCARFSKGVTFSGTARRRQQNLIHVVAPNASATAPERSVETGHARLAGRC